LESLLAEREKPSELPATSLSVPAPSFPALLEGLPELYVVLPSDTPRFTHHTQDVTERMRLEEREKQERAAHLRAEERIGSILAGMTDAFLVLDKEWRIQFVNREAARINGEMPEAFLGKTHWEEWPASVGTPVEAAYRRAMAEQVTVHLEHHCQDAAHDVWLEISAYPTEESLGVFCRDITARKQVEEALRLHTEEIEILNVRLQKSMIETHHRVKNNLQMVSALIDIQRAGGGETVPMAELARLGANVLALGIIHDILTQEAKAGSDQDLLSVRAVLERLVRVLEQTMGDRPLKSAFDEARLVSKQAAALALVTNELVSNALKHGSGTTEVCFRVHSNTATLEVCDDGPGFPDGFNAETASNTGLELVENIVRLDLRGQVVYANRLEGGAWVTVVFPITTQQERD